MSKKININFYGLIILVIGLVSFPIIFVLFYYFQPLYGVIALIICLYLINSLLSLWIVNSKKRTNYGKSTWLLAFILFPVIGITLFFIWGRSPYEFRNKQKYFEHQKQFIEKYNFSYLNEFINDENKINDLFIFSLKYNYSLWKEPLYKNNNIEIIKSNELFLQEIVNGIRLAEKIIYFNYYIIDENSISFKIIYNELIKKAKEGIRIYVIYDRFGTYRKLSFQTLKKMYLNNINILEFESSKDYFIASTTNYRSHKKLLLIDNKLAITGGSNIGDEYLNIGIEFSNWNDLNIKVSGPIIQRLASHFSSDWIANTTEPFKIKFFDYKKCNFFFTKFIVFLLFKLLSKKKKETYNKINKLRNKYNIWEEWLFLFQNKTKYIKLNNEIKDCNINFSIVNPRFYNKSLIEQLNAAFMYAKKRIVIVSPYFYPDDSILDIINAIAKFGVLIDIILPGKDDKKWFLMYMNRSNLWKLNNLENVNIYEYDGFIHTKTITIDDKYSIIGSFNFDLRSSSSNFENFLIIDSFEFNQKLQKYFSHIINFSKNTKNISEIQKPSFFFHIISFLLKIIHPLI